MSERVKEMVESMERQNSQEIKKKNEKNMLVRKGEGDLPIILVKNLKEPDYAQLQV